MASMTGSVERALRVNQGAFHLGHFACLPYVLDHWVGRWQRRDATGWMRLVEDKEHRTAILAFLAVDQRNHGPRVVTKTWIAVQRRAKRPKRTPLQIVTPEAAPQYR
jgi:hypothetical protein